MDVSREDVVSVNRDDSAASGNGNGKVRVGGQGPIFRKPGISDSGKVRVGGQGPIFRKPDISDSGKVRVGGQGPIFR